MRKWKGKAIIKRKKGSPRILFSLHFALHFITVT